MRLSPSWGPRKTSNRRTSSRRSPAASRMTASKEDLEEMCTYPLQKCVECGTYFASAKEVDYAARIISQNADDDEAAETLELIGTCSQCKQ